MPEFKKLPLDENGKLIINNYRLQSPENLVMVSFPKSGKTLCMVNQKGFLIGDPEEGTSYFGANNYVNLNTYDGKDEFVKIKNGTYIPAGIFQTVDELNKANRMKEYWALKARLDERLPSNEKETIFKDLKQMIADMPFPIYATDTITTLQELNLKAALAEYNARFGKAKTDIKKVDDYGGVQYIRTNFMGIKEFIENNAAPFKIWTGHVKEKKKILKKAEDEISAVDMALDGLLPTMFTARASAVCIFYRDDKGCYLDFRKKDESDLGSRPQHLANKLIKIADPLKEGDLYPKCYWELVYPDLTF